MNIFNRLLALSICLLIAHTGYAQEDEEDKTLDTEVVNIVRPYTPSLSDAFKIKQTPVINDSVTSQKQDVTYGIFSVPVASTFTPAKGTAVGVEKAARAPLYDNYATLGFGNYTTALAEFYSSWQLSRTDNFGLFLRHNSAQGDIEDVDLDASFLDTDLSLSYSSFQRDMAYDLNLDVTHQLYNWYGLSPIRSIPDDVLNGIDPKQTYFSAAVSGGLSLEDSYFKQGRGSLSFLSDSFGSSELRAVFEPQVVLPITEYEFLLNVDLDFVSGSFERGYLDMMPIDYGFLNLGVSPALEILDDDLTLFLGAAVYLGQDIENSDIDFFLYPRVRASYRLLDDTVIAYGGVEGDLVQNSFYGFKEENPFVSPTLVIAPTDQVYDAYVGFKGKFAGNVSYNIRGGYKNENNKPLFLSNPFKGASAEFEGYEFGNSFEVIYDDISTVNLFGELKIALSDKATFGVSGSYFGYDGDLTGSTPFNLPEFTGSATIDVQFTDKIFAGASLFFVGERNDVLSDTFVNTLPVVITLDSYFDANIYATYRINERVSIFARGNNLVGTNYQRWLNFPVQGLQVMAGATYKFNW